MAGDPLPPGWNGNGGPPGLNGGPPRRPARPPPPPPPSSTSSNSQEPARPPPPPPPPPPPQVKRARPDEPASEELTKKHKPAPPKKPKKKVTSKWRPPSQLRATMDAHVDMSKRHANADKRAYLGALKFLPHAIFKLLENMPDPWQVEKPVEVLYHVTGAVTFVNEQPNIVEPVYRAQWGECWDEMRREKHDRTNFRRMRLPPFDDDEPPLSWQEHLTGIEAPDGVPIDIVTPDRRKSWTLGVEERHKLLRASLPLLRRPRSHYCFDDQSLATAKALNIAVQNGPKFEPLFRDDASSNADEFDDPSRIIFRQPIRNEARVAFPNLYNQHPRQIQPAAYHDPVSSVVRGGPRAFFVDKTINEITVPKPNGPPPKVEPFLSDISLDIPGLKESIEVWNAPKPFSSAHGRIRRAEDVAFIQPWVRQRPKRGLVPKTRISYQRLLKVHVKRYLQRKRHGSATTKTRLLSSLKSTKFFHTTTIDWLEAGLQLCRQGYQILQLLIHKKGLHFLHLDYNFNLKPTKTLTTKERKRSRFGNSFHLVRELLKAIKLIVDAHVQFRLGNVDAFELADGLNYIFNHMGQLTGIYRYKYKVMRQIRACKDLKHVVYAEFNANGVGKGPGCGFWQPAWRVWLSWLRGTIPLLERWLGNLLVRQFEGRVAKSIAKTVTKQRIDSQYDLELRDAVLHEILDMIPESIRASKTRTILNHLGEAWRCWKANIPWDVPGMPPPVTAMIERYVRAKADAYVRGTHINRDRIRRGATVDKSVSRKNAGRVTRLWLKDEQERQAKYASEGPYIQADEAVTVYTTVSQWLQSQEFEPIEFPAVGYKDDNKLLVLALESLRDTFPAAGARLNQTQREELALIENGFDNPHETLIKIKRSLLGQRVFKEVSVELNDLGATLTPVYSVDSFEKIADAYLDQYLWYEAGRKGLFPSWIKPSDDEVPPVLVHKWCSGITNLKDVWATDGEQSTIHMQMTLGKFVENADLTLLNKLLKLIVDPSIADYISSKLNAVLTYKDMRHVNQVGIIRGFQFSSFVIQYYGFVFDLLLLGLGRASELADAPRFSRWASPSIEKSHPIRLYCRYFDKCYFLVRLDHEETVDLLEDASHLASDEPYPTAQCWPKDWRMRLIMRDTTLGRALFAEFRTRVPESMAKISWDTSLVSVYSVDNPALTFSMAGFEVRLAPRTRLADEGVSATESSWHIIDDETQERSAVAFLRVSQVDGIDKFMHRIRQILMSSGATTFAKIIKRWNTALTALVTYYREAAVCTPELLDTLVKCEVRIQNKVKMGLNSKMPSRFPLCVFYSPEELGGLGMLSASHILIPMADLRWSKQSGDGRITHFKAGMADADGSLVPNLFRYVTPWATEISDSQRVWTDYLQLKAEARQENRRIGLEDLEDSWDRGLPRINTLFQKERQTLASNRGYRARDEYRTYSNPKYNPFWWTNQRHDGRLWNFHTYRTDMIQALGGIDAILEHSLFKGTGFESWEGLFWDRGGGLEDQLQQFKKLTNAQRTGLSQIPNRRFTLWWSPTINRANVYVGFLVQLDLTGIFLHGKIPTLKISLIQIFRAHLWQKIHESLVIDLCQVLDRDLDTLQIESVTKEAIHPRKSYRLSSSAADVTLTSTFRWPVSKPSLLNSPPQNDNMDFATAEKFWIDVQLRYGDYDSHDISRYTRAKFLDYTSDGMSLYPSATGIVICVDLAYNVYDAYGNWFPGLKQLVQKAMAKIMKVNPALFVLRERIRKALQLYQAQPTQPRLTSGNYTDLFGGHDGSLFVDDSIVYRVKTHKTVEGNVTARPINGAVVVVNPRTGQLFLKVLEAGSTWAGQKRRVALSKWKTAEEVGALLRTLDRDELPKQIIITSRGLSDPLEVHMLDYPNIAVRTSELNLPFGTLLALPLMADLVDNATESKLVLLNLYDDWLEAVEPATAFSRLMLILRGLSANQDKAKLILRPSPSVKTAPEHLWPSLTKDEWINVENELSELVLADFGRRNAVNIQALTQSEIRDIILGQPIKAPSQERQNALVQAIESSAASAENHQLTALKTKTHNVHGEEMTVVTTSNYEQQMFESKATWRQRAIAASGLHLRSRHLYVEAHSPDDLVTKFVMPKDIIQQFIEAADVRSQVGGLLYGRSCPDNPDAKLICAIAVMPQLGTTTTLSMAPDPTDQIDPELELLGVLHTQIQERTDISPTDLLFCSQRGWSEGKLVLSLVFTAGSVTLVPLMPTAVGIEWGASNRDLLSQEPEGYDGPSFAKQAQLALADKTKGFMYVPEDGVWNHAFLGALWNPRAKAYLEVGRPLPYYHELHRPVHFLSAMRMEDRYDEFDNNFE